MSHHDVKRHLHLAEKENHLWVQSLLGSSLFAGLLGLARAGLLLIRILVTRSLAFQSGHICGDLLIIAAIITAGFHTTSRALGLLLLLGLLVSLGLLRLDDFLALVLVLGFTWPSCRTFRAHTCPMPFFTTDETLECRFLRAGPRVVSCLLAVKTRHARPCCHCR